MAQTLYDALHANLTGRSKYDFQQNFAFHFEPASFFSVNRTRLERDLGGDCFGHCLRSFGFDGGGGDYVGIAKAALAYRTTRSGDAAGIIAGGDAIAKTRAGDYAPSTFRSASAITAPSASPSLSAG